MNFIVTGNTDIGLTKSTNQDSLFIRVFNTQQGKMVLAVICDGMGGLQKGEVASASVIRAFEEWSRLSLPELSKNFIADVDIRTQWGQVIKEQNNKIKNYGLSLGIRLGTTVTALLITQDRFYVLNVGDSRAYVINDQIKQITNDQTFVAREVSLKRMTEEQAKHDERRSILLQCVGASEEVYPDFFFGDAQINTVYMLCCDGFVHEISSEEIFNYFMPEKMIDENSMNNASKELICLNKNRKERDNITVALIRSF